MRKDQRPGAAAAFGDIVKYPAALPGKNMPYAIQHLFRFRTAESSRPGRSSSTLLRCGLMLFLFYSGLVNAFWSGVAFEFGSIDSDWDFKRETREAQIDQISIKLEDKVGSSLTGGLELGYFDMRVVAPDSSTAETLKFDGGFFSVYLRQPVDISDWLSLYGKIGLRYTSGSESGDGDADIDWTTALFELGMGLRFSNYRITPFVTYEDVDGDISNDGTETFEMDEEVSQGIKFDYFTDSVSFIQLVFVTGGNEGGYINFVRRY